MTKTVFITGCSSGIGFYLACALKQKGYQVVASCRKSDDVKRLQDLGLQAVEMDVSDSTSIQQGVRLLLDYTQNRVDVLINNAGYGQVGALEDISREVMMAQFQVNVFGLHELTREIIPVMRKEGGGRIINISSVLGVISLPFRGAYNASKYAVEGITDTLRMELESSKIWVSSIQPGAIDSCFRDTAINSALEAVDKKSSHFSRQYETMFSRYKKNSKMPIGPEAVFKKVICAIDSKKPKPNYVVTLAAHFIVFVRRILPRRWLHRLLVKISHNELSVE